MARIHNAPALASTSCRADALFIAEAALEAVDTGSAVRRGVELRGEVLRVLDRDVSLSGTGRVLLVAVGKCAAAAAQALHGILGARLAGGIVLDVREALPGRSGPLRFLAGTHPLPSERNVAATREILALVDGAGERDLVLVVVSGGGSTLLCAPPPGLGVEDERVALEALTRAGADIGEINTVRRHLSLARGGNLAARAFPARVVALVFSDVPGDRLEVIASGPTVMDASRVEDAAAVLGKYRLDTLPLVETPKDERLFARVQNVLFVSNRVALEAMVEVAAARRYAPRVVTRELTGEARDVAGRVVMDLRSAPPGSALLYGGETTVTVRGPGRGGRSLELALAALRLVENGELVLTLASDGRDNGEWAGGIADAAGRETARRAGLDLDRLLADNDSCGCFASTGDWLETGATGSNVADLVLALKP